MADKKCIHCRLRKQRSKCRGLCYRCSIDPDLRELYPPTTSHAPRNETMEQLEAIIAEQSRDLPDWWANDLEHNEETHARHAKPRTRFIMPSLNQRGRRVIRKR